MSRSMKDITLLALGCVALFVALTRLEAVVAFLGTLVGYVQPVLVGGVIAFFLNVPMTAIERGLSAAARKAKRPVKPALLRSVALVLTLLGVGLVFTLVIVIVVPEFITSISSIINTTLEKIPGWLAALEQQGLDTQWLKSQLDALHLSELDLSALAQKLTAGAGSLLEALLRLTISAVGTLSNALIALVLAVYMLSGKDALRAQFKTLLFAFLPEKVAREACRVGDLVNRTFFKFLTGQCVDSLLLGVMLFIAFSIFRIPYASVVAVTTAVFSFIPYVGAFLACAISILLILMVNPVKALVGLIVFLTVQFCEGQFLYPRVVGNSVGLSPLWTLVAALVGGELLGILGMIFFIPVGAVTYQLLRERAQLVLRKKTAAKPE